MEEWRGGGKPYALSCSHNVIGGKTHHSLGSIQFLTVYSYEVVNFSLTGRASEHMLRTCNLKRRMRAWVENGRDKK